MFDDYTALLVSVSAVVYLLRALPPLLAPSGLLGGAIYLAVGLLAGISLAAATLVLIFLSCTEPKPPSNAPPTKATPPPPSAALHPLSITPRVRAATSALLQHRKRGRYSGTVYLVPASRWPRDGALDDFPPPTSGPSAVATRWHAKLRGTTLTLAQEVPGRSHKVYINLEGCEVSVVREGLVAPTHTRTIWWKKAPLEVAHPDRPLLFGESSLMLFAEHGGAKEQWYLALQWATSEGGLAKAVSGLYAAYCAHLRAHSAVHLPRPQEAAALLEADALHHAHAGSPGAGPLTPRRRGWFRLKSTNPATRAASRRRITGGASSLSPHAMGVEAGSPRPPTVPPNLPMMDPDELDRRWMSSRRASSAAGAAPLAPAAAASSSLGSQVGALAAGSVAVGRSSRAGPRSVAQPVGETAPMAEGEDAVAQDGAPRAAACISPRQRRPALAPLRISDPASPAATAASQPLPAHDPLATLSEGPHVCTSHSQPVHGTGTDDAAAAPSAAAQPAQAAGAEDDPAAPRPTPPPPPPPPTMPALYGVNMFLARGAFELLRSKPFEARVQEMIQRKLSDIRRPPYIQELMLSSLDMGATVPLIKSAHSLPPASNAIWPQVQLEVAYPGTFSLTIETKLDLHKAPAFGRIERTLHHIRGPSRTQDEGELPDGVGAEDLPRGAGAGERAGGSPGREGGGGRGGGEAGDSSGEEGEEDEELEEAVNSGARERLASHTAQQLREQGQGSRRRAPLLGVLQSGYKALRRAAVDYAQQGLHNVAKSLSLIPFQLEVNVTRLEGKLLLWVPPPPSDRLWYSFVEPPDVVIRARPIIGNRVLKHSITFMLNRVSDWLERKLLRALRKNLVLPACGDIRLGAFASLEASLFARHLSLATHHTADHESDSSPEASDSDDGGPSAGGPDDTVGPLPASSPFTGAPLLSHSVRLSQELSGGLHASGGLSGRLQSAPSDGPPSTHHPGSPARPKHQPQSSMSLTVDRPMSSPLADRPTPSALLDPHIQAELHMRLPLLSRSGAASSCSSSTQGSPSPTLSARGSPSGGARAPGSEASGPLAAIARRSRKMKEKKERRREERQQRERQLEQEAWDRGEVPPAPKTSPRKMFFRGSHKLHRNRSQSMTEAVALPSGSSFNAYHIVRPTRSMADMSHLDSGPPPFASSPLDPSHPLPHPNGYGWDAPPLSLLDHAESAPESYSPLAPYSPSSYYDRFAPHSNPFADSRPTDSPLSDSPSARPHRTLKQTLSSLSPRSRRSTAASNSDLPSTATSPLDPPTNPRAPPTASLDPNPMPTPFQGPPYADSPSRVSFSNPTFAPDTPTSLRSSPPADPSSQPGDPWSPTDSMDPRQAASFTSAAGQSSAAAAGHPAPGTAFWRRANAAVTAAGAAVAATGKAVAARAPIPVPSPEQPLGRWRTMLGEMLKAKGEGGLDGGSPPALGNGDAAAPGARVSF